MGFCNIQQHFARYAHAKLFISNWLLSSDIEQNSEGGIFDSRTSGQSLIKVNCHNSRTSYDIDMDLGPEKQSRVKKKTDDNVMSGNCDIIVIFLIYGQFGAIRKADSGYIVCKTYIFINNNLLS